MTMHRRIRTLAFSAILLALPAQAALAQDANALGERIKGVLAEQGITINWSGIEQNGAQVVLKGVTFAAQGGAASPAIGDITLDNITEADGGYDIGTVTFPGYSANEDGMAVDVTGVTMSGVAIPAPGSKEPTSAFMMYDSAKLDSVSVKQGDTQLFSLNDLHFEMTPPADGNAMEFSGAAEKFSVDLSKVTDPQSKAVIDALGYQKLNGFLEMSGSWQPTDGTLSLSQYDLTVENAGTLGMTFDIGGYTPEFIKSLQEMQKKMASAPAGSDQSAQGIAMLGLMQQLTLSGMSIRFDDDSLANKAIEYVAKMQNVSPADIKNQAKALTPFLTGQLQNPELGSQIVTAVNAFMDDPKSIEIAAEPAQPVPFSQIAAAGMGNPLELTKTLGVRVTANEGGEDEDTEGDAGSSSDDAGDDTAQ